jgi:hypothetical protein
MTPNLHDISVLSALQTISQQNAQQLTMMSLMLNAITTFNAQQSQYNARSLQQQDLLIKTIQKQSTQAPFSPHSVPIPQKQSLPDPTTTETSQSDPNTLLAVLTMCLNMINNKNDQQFDLQALLDSYNDTFIMPIDSNKTPLRELTAPAAVITKKNHIPLSFPVHNMVSESAQNLKTGVIGSRGRTVRQIQQQLDQRIKNSELGTLFESTNENGEKQFEQNSKYNWSPNVMNHTPQQNSQPYNCQDLMSKFSAQTDQYNEMSSLEANHIEHNSNMGLLPPEAKRKGRPPKTKRTRRHFDNNSDGEDLEDEYRPPPAVVAPINTVRMTRRAYELENTIDNNVIGYDYNHKDFSKQVVNQFQNYQTPLPTTNTTMITSAGTTRDVTPVISPNLTFKPASLQLPPYQQLGQRVDVGGNKILIESDGSESDGYFEGCERRSAQNKKKRQKRIVQAPQLNTENLDDGNNSDTNTHAGTPSAPQISLRIVGNYTPAEQREFFERTTLPSFDPLRRKVITLLDSRFPRTVIPHASYIALSKWYLDLIDQRRPLDLFLTRAEKAEVAKKWNVSSQSFHCWLTKTNEHLFAFLLQEDPILRWEAIKERKIDPNGPTFDTHYEHLLAIAMNYRKKLMIPGERSEFLSALGVEEKMPYEVEPGEIYTPKSDEKDTIVRELYQKWSLWRENGSPSDTESGDEGNGGGQNNVVEDLDDDGDGGGGGGDGDGDDGDGDDDDGGEGNLMNDSETDQIHSDQINEQNDQENSPIESNERIQPVKEENDRETISNNQIVSSIPPQTKLIPVIALDSDTDNDLNNPIATMTGSKNNSLSHDGNNNDDQIIERNRGIQTTPDIDLDNKIPLHDLDEKDDGYSRKFHLNKTV